MKQNGMYWLFFSPMIKSSIRKRYGRELADRAVKKGRLEYRRLVESAPELGKGNPMASNAYFAYVFVGAWLGTKEKISTEEKNSAEKELSPDDMALIMTDVLAKVRWFFGMTDLNRMPDKWYRDMKKYEQWYDAGNGEKYPATWKVHFDEKRHKDGSYYYFSACPIYSYLTGIGLGEIMKPLCETDRVMFAYQHGKLYREHTIAEGTGVCDYWSVGDRVKNPQ